MYKKDFVKETSNNFNHERLKLIDALSQLNDQINNLKEDLLNYSSKPNPSGKYIFFKKKQIQILESVLIAINDNIEITNQIFDAKQKEIAKLKIDILKLQGICLYHGISNLNFYLQMKPNALIITVKRAFDEGFRQTPFDLIENYPQDEKNKMQIAHLVMTAKQLKVNGK